MLGANILKFHIVNSLKCGLMLAWVLYKGKISICVQSFHISIAVESYSWLCYFEYCINSLSLRFVFKNKQK